MKPYVLLGAALVTAVVCVRLGLWQLRRLDERRALNATRVARLALPPLEVDGRRGLDAALTDRRAVAEGRFDFARELVLVGRSFRGVPGVRLVTPLRLVDGSALLVERGWVPSPDGRSIDVASYREPEQARVTGVLLDGSATDEPPVPVDSAWPHYMRRASPAALRRAYPYPLLALVLRRTAPPDVAPHGLRLVPLPQLSSGPHLSYAIQWFAFATIAIVGSVTLVAKSRPARNREA